MRDGGAVHGHQRLGDAGVVCMVTEDAWKRQSVVG